MPAWAWNSILTYEIAGETFTAETFIYFTQEGYQHAYGQDHETELNFSSLNHRNQPCLCSHIFPPKSPLLSVQERKVSIYRNFYQKILT